MDDERDLVEMVVFSLRKRGYDSTRAFGGREAWERMTSETFDLVVLDLDARSFHRGRNALEKPGIGLGLPLVKRVLECHDGEIEVQSEIGRGSTFSIRLPAGDGLRQKGGKMPGQSLQLFYKAVIPA